jgi:ABC-type amino acid transport substrate-binding protein
MDRLLSPKLLQLVWLSLFSLSLFADSKRSHVIGVFEGIDREIAVEDGKLIGRFAPYYQCVFSRVRGDFQFVEMPLAQMLYRLEKGGISAGLPMVQTSERDEYADFGGLLFQTEYVYLLLQDLPPLSSLAGLRFAFVRQFVGDKLLQGDDPRVIHVSDWSQAVEMLKLGRVDVVVLPWVLIDIYMEGFDKPYYDRTAAWVDLSMYISHKVEDSSLTKDLRDAIEACRFIADQNQAGWGLPSKGQIQQD